jgi:Na+/H+-dicarboxylate symporter
MPKTRLSFTTKVFIGLGLGIVFGLAFPKLAPSVQIFGDLFVKAIRMVILPMILLCVTAGIAQMGDMRTVGKTGVAMVLFAAVVNFFSALTGVLFGVLVNPANGVIIPSGLKASAYTPVKATDVLLSVVPDNIFSALAANNIMAIVFFAMFLGVAIILAGKRGKPILAVVQSGSDVVAEIIRVVVKTTPYAVFCLIAIIIAKNGPDILGSLAKFLATIWIGTILYVLLCTLFISKFITKKSWTQFIRSTAEAAMMGMATCSAVATMPINVANTEKYLGVPKPIGTLVIGTGTVLIHGGSAFYKAIATYFLVTLYGVHLSFSGLVLITLLAAFVNTVGVPSSATLATAIALNVFGVPLEGIALLMGVDRLRDMISTAGNVVIQSAGAAAVYSVSGDLAPMEAAEAESYVKAAQGR